MGARRGLLVALLVVAGCAADGSAATAPTTTRATTTRPTTTRPTTTLAPIADPKAPATILTPGEDAPNPFVLHEGGTYWLYASQKEFYGDNLQVRSGPDLHHLGPVHDALPVLPDWVWAGFTWAPDVRHIGNRYVLWFTAGVVESRPDAPRPTQCIGVATSSSPDGPFTGVGDGPAICQRQRWGSIDPRTFRDVDGQLWLHWKSDDNAEVDGTTHSSIYAQRLAADGITLVGRAMRILEADQPWEGRIVEAPQLIRVGGRYWLFYSGNWFNQPVYGIGVAECAGPAGPCRKRLRRPWLGSNPQGAGPGESSLFHDAGGWWILYGPWAVDFEASTPRPAALARVGFGPLGPYLARP
ncbi:MAG: glycoside hydrolase, family 43 [Actinomycetia bacterium]|nr:glycoside hydrolase, family 43 [Actinomycetes bacterium]